METVESPLDVLSRAATMVRHCRAFSSPEKADDAENVNNNSPCGSNESMSPSSGEDVITDYSGSVVPATKQITAAKLRHERRARSSGRYRHIYTREINEGKAHLKNQRKLFPSARQEQKSNSDAENLSKKVTPHKEPKNNADFVETPLDMSVKMKSSSSPPSYSHAISSGHVHRPSVITQTSNNVTNNSISPPPICKLNGGKGEYIPGSMSMCDPVIDEHFRRSLGADYMSLFAKTNSPNEATNEKAQKISTKDRGSSPIMFASDPCVKYLIPNPKFSNNVSNKKVKNVECNKEASNDDANEKEQFIMDIDESAGLSVDDHFAKALGDDTWKKLQENSLNKDMGKNNEKKDVESSPSVTKDNDEDEQFDLSSDESNTST